MALHAKPAGVVALHSSAVYDTPISVLSVIVPHHTFPNKFGVIYCIPLAMLGLWLRYLYVFKRKTSFFIRNCEQYPNIDIMAVNAYSKKKKVDRLSK